MLAPAACSAGKVRRIAPSPITTAATIVSRRTISTCVRTRRAYRLSGTSSRYRASPRSSTNTASAAANQTPEAIAMMRKVWWMTSRQPGRHVAGQADRHGDPQHDTSRKQRNGMRARLISSCAQARRRAVGAQDHAGEGGDDDGGQDRDDARDREARPGTEVEHVRGLLRV